MDRAPQPTVDDERGLLLGWLQFHRDALAVMCEALTDHQLVAQPAPPSSLSLLGLVRHLTEMERHYFVHALTAEDKGLNYCTDDDDEADIEGLDVSMVPDSMSQWRTEMAEADRLLAAESDLDSQVATGWGSVRLFVLKVLQEFSRHNGHADILRERIEGSRGE
jgi:hypothetical protein